MKGRYPVDYFKNPHMDKERSIEQIWDDIDAYSGEYFEDETDFHEKIDVVVPIPPLLYKGKMTKGVMFSQGSEYVFKLYPKLKNLFFLCAYTMWSSYSWSENSDCYLTCYENKEREEYYKNKYPRKRHITFIPLQDADFGHEYSCAPVPDTPKTIDVLMVSSPIAVKNLPMMASAIKVYEKVYNYKLKVTMALGDNSFVKKEDGTLDVSGAPQYRADIIREIDNILDGKMYDYINFEPYIANNDLPKYYTAAKCTALTSLIEGKNRCIFESMSCDTPVVVFKDHNKWARGNHPIFFGNSGELVPEFTPEALADTIHKVINNPDDYEPRKNHLLHSGRKNFVDILTDYMPYYAKNVPNYNGAKFHDNLWIDLACQYNYSMSYNEFLYGKRPGIFHVRGLNDIAFLMNFYYNKFNVK